MNEILINKIKDFFKENDYSILDVFLYEIGLDFIEQMGLEKYVSRVEILEEYNKNPLTKGIYDKGKVTIFKSGIENSINVSLKNVLFLSETELYIYRTFFYLKTLLHELEHVRQKNISAKFG